MGDSQGDKLEGICRGDKFTHVNEKIYVVMKTLSGVGHVMNSNMANMVYVGEHCT